MIVAFEPQVPELPARDQVELVELHGPHDPGVQRPEGEQEEDQAAHLHTRNMVARRR